MLNLFETPRKAVRTLTARLPFKTLTCETVAPLLMPFTENALDAKTHTRIAQHVAACPDCQTEAAMLGEMGNFFRANPPQPVVPAPNLWQSIEAQIQAETPERIAAYKTGPRNTPAPVPVAGRFDWSGFARSFAATGGVMTAAIACVWFVAGQFPVEHSAPAPRTVASSVTTDNGSEAVTILLPMKRTVPGQIKAAPIVASRAERVPALRQKAFVMVAQGRQDFALLAPSRAAEAPLIRRTAAKTPVGRVNNTLSKSTHEQVPLASPASNRNSFYYAAGRTKEPEPRYATSPIPVNSVKNEDFQASADTNQGDALPIVRDMLDAALEKATVVAVAASLSSTETRQNDVTASARPGLGIQAVVAEAAAPTTESTYSMTVEPERDEDTITRRAPEKSVRRAARGTQVAWLVEDGARSERSAADATRTERRQQSLFSYGRR